MNIFKIALPNNDVKTARLADEVLDSRYPSPKIDTKASPPHAGILDINWQSSNIVIPHQQTRLLHRFPHKYGYIPTAFGVYTFDNGSRKTSGTLPLSIGAVGIITIDTDDTYVNFTYFSIDFTDITSIPPFIMQIRFYVMAERGYD